MHLTYLISQDYARATGGWIYNERLLKELAALGWRIHREELPAGFPDPDVNAYESAFETVFALPRLTLILADQVCLSPLWPSMESERLKHRFAMIMHHPQILEGSRPPEVSKRLDTDERRALMLADCVIATSRLTGKQMLGDYRVPPEKLVIAEPGTDLFPPAPGSGGPALHLISIGSVIPRKRHELIIAALMGLQGLDWRLTIAGHLGMVPDHADKLRRLIAASGLAGRVTLLGEQTGAELKALWKCADVYVAAAAHEGFGMAVAEAVARQIPVVSTTSGAVGDWLSREAGLIVDPDTAEAFAITLRPVLADPALRAALRAGAAAARATLPTWQQTAAKIDAALRPFALGT